MASLSHSQMGNKPGPCFQTTSNNESINCHPPAKEEVQVVQASEIEMMLPTFFLSFFSTETGSAFVGLEDFGVDACCYECKKD
jgi:hypothetical protein